MGVCPECGYEYERHVTECPDCEVGLVQPEDTPAIERELEIDPELARQKLVTVYRGYDEESVRRVHGALRAERVRATVRSFEHPWMPWNLRVSLSFNDPLGAWGEVLVLERDAERAAEIVEVIEMGRIVEEDEEEGETDA
ncbi:MAG: hypothetical protein ACE5JM_06200 [Armatimonadota bacterium]